ncbi:M23 family metallopeptidase [Aegicerativicinus sediminis]
MKYLFLLLFFTNLSYSQQEYPQDYFRNPLEVPVVLAGTFAELRSNHFHSGMDIKTQGQEGLNVVASADGYISRIKISPFGYGKAIYITHPNGYTTVYGHLQKLSPSLETYIKKVQYAKEQFDVEVFPAVDELKVFKGELVAISGNTGSSAGPHLHFEIRDKNERPLNPMLFGINTQDTKKPAITGLFAYTKNHSSHINNTLGRRELRLIADNNGDYTTQKIDAEGTIGFGVISYDQQDLAYNKNGLYNIQTFLNGSRHFEIDFRRFSFDETRHINRLIDYGYYRDKDERIQKLFIEENNPLNLYKNAQNDGYLKVKDSLSYSYKIRLSDFEGNDTWITIPIEGKKGKNVSSFESKGNVDLIANQSNKLADGKWKVTIPANVLYENTSINYKVIGDTLKLHEDVIPLIKSFNIEYDLTSYKELDRNLLYIAQLSKNGKKIYFTGASRKGDFLSAWENNFGTFTIGIDSISPSITAVNFKDGQWISSANSLIIKIEDSESGISNYRATVNGKWILMEYDYKKDLLIHNFDDGVLTEAENKLKVIVTDNVGNSSTFIATFYRK